MADARKKAAGYHGIQNMQFAPLESAGYATTPLKLLYAKNINPTALLEAVDQHADNRLLFRIPSDNGYEGQIGTTAADPELEKAAGYAMEAEHGIIGTDIVRYLRGALYYEFIERDEHGDGSVVKVWLFNAEIGKGSATHSTNTRTLEFGEYSYPFTVYGDTLMDATGDEPYLDEKGMGRKAFMYTARPGDDGYPDFGKTVPTPKVAASGGTGGTGGG